MGRVKARLNELKIDLPEPSRPGANYVPFVRSGNLLFLTGQLSQWNGERRFVGKVGREYGLTEGQHAARLCALNLLALLKVALHELGHNFGLLHHYGHDKAEDGAYCPMTKGDFNRFGERAYVRAVIDARGFRFCRGCETFLRERYA